MQEQDEEQQQQQQQQSKGRNRSSSRSKGRNRNRSRNRSRSRSRSRGRNRSRSRNRTRRRTTIVLCCLFAARGELIFVCPMLVTRRRAHNLPPGCCENGHLSGPELGTKNSMHFRSI